MQLPKIIETRGERVLTTKQIANCYETTKEKLIWNFNHNRKRYIEGKHYMEIKGEELKELKRTCENQISFKYAKTLYLWTEKGCLLHAKSLNTDKAWEVYDYLVDFYFRQKGKKEPERRTIEKAEKTDIEPYFRKLISTLPIEALDAMEKSLRKNRETPVRMASLEVLAEKMKRELL